MLDTARRIEAGKHSDLDAWIRWARVEKGLAETTVSAYLRDLRDLGDLRPRLQTEALRSLLHARGGSAATVSRRIAAWRSYYRWAVRTDQRPDDPTVGLDRPKLRPGLPKPVEDLERTLTSLDPVMQAVAVFLAETGLRISEACSVAIDLPPAAALRVKGKGSKERLVPLSPLAAEALTELGGRLPLAARTIQRRFQAVGITPHRLRHTFASALAEADVDLSVIQDLLGHASPATTRIYQRNDIRRLTEGVARRG